MSLQSSQIPREAAYLLGGEEPKMSTTISADGVFQVPAFFAEFIDAPDLESIAKRLIAENDSFWSLRQNDDVTIRYLWKLKGGAKGGKATLGKCQKLSGVSQHFAGGADFLIWAAADHARFFELTNRQMEALVAHELRHIQIDEDEDGNVTLRVRGHDVELFVDDVVEYGLWTADLQQAAKAFEQARLPGV